MVVPGAARDMLSLSPHTRPRNGPVTKLIVHRRRCGLPYTRARNSAEIPIARNCFANEGLIVRKPNSGSARHRWARENSKHRRTATRQRGFCSSVLKQYPLDLLQSRVTLEHRPFKIVSKIA